MRTLEGGKEAVSLKVDLAEEIPLDLDAAAQKAPVDRDQALQMLHDLNNALVSILLNTQLAGLRLPSYSRMKRNLKEVELSARRSAMLVKRLEIWANVTGHGGVR